MRDRDIDKSDVLLLQDMVRNRPFRWGSLQSML